MRLKFVILLGFFCALLHAFAAPATSPAIVDLNTPREFPAITNLEQWQARAQRIREQILVSSGLWPMPEKTLLHAKIFGKIVCDGYSVEKVYFQAWPGFYVAGNLYRPVGDGKGPFPATLVTHGHWENGRLVDSAEASFPGLCINFARQGIIAFSYDMVGYNDTHFADSPTKVAFYKIHRDFQTNNPAAQLWGISLMGLQTWDSIRALDFLVSLPDVDPHRLGCTGASGGGTQTFLLGAIDDRLAVQAPVVMVSHTMQGGCLCENMPGLRVEFSNMEIAAAAAPRPQILVGASGDWTKTTPTMEGPAIEEIYYLFDAVENLRYVRFDFPHNYNQTSREAVYQWFDKVLLAQPDTPVKEVAFKKEPDADLRVFPEGKLPPNAVSQAALVQSLIREHQAQLRALQPRNEKSLAHYREIMKPALERTLHLEYSSTRFSFDMPENLFNVQKDATHPGYYVDVVTVKSPDKPHSATSVLFFTPTNTVRTSFFSPTNATKATVVLVDAQGSAAMTDESVKAKGLALELLKRNFQVAVLKSIPPVPRFDQISILFNTYNRTWLQQRVIDVAAAAAAAQEWQSWQWWLSGSGGDDKRRIIFCGSGRAGLWSLLAAPAADAVIADCDELDVSNDQNLLASDLFCPGLRNVDTFNGALILAAPHPLLLHNTGGHFPKDELQTTYKILGASNHLRIEKTKLTDEQIVEWITNLQ